MPASSRLTKAVLLAVLVAAIRVAALPLRGTEDVLTWKIWAIAASKDVTAVYVATDPEAATAVQEKWGYWGAGVRLVILDSPYRLLIEPLVGYVRELAARRQPNEVMTIVVPQFVPEQGWHNILHAQTAIMLRFALLFQPGVVITSVPYQVRTEK